ncbi:hypothetical protein C6497_16880 [Candidatus Poribacteria bacterium]|nr:MAG: hypothetical protein C6497_16880 [Candidatus Poribacteria bacterium]
MIIPRYVFVNVVLLAFSLCLSANAKHIIVVYDVSSSMYRLKVASGVRTFMEPEDIQRVNDYLTNLLFKNASHSLHDSDDAYIKNCVPAYAGQPLYQSGDIITYAEYAERRYPKLNRQQIRRVEFQAKLPDPMNLRRSFYGNVSYLLRAEVEVYEKLYSENDDETYWIFVTDGDVDRSAENDPKFSQVLQQHAAIEDKFDDMMIVGILVNNHVKIEVRRIQKRMPDEIYIANRTTQNENIKEIQISKDDAGQYISETLVINTKNADRTKYKLKSVNVEIFDNSNKPLQIINENKEISYLKVTPVLLHGHSPPFEFKITLPGKPELTARDNTLKLEVVYNYDGQEKAHLIPPTMTVIKDVFISDLNHPNQQIEKADLRLSDGMYLASFSIRSESSIKTAFKLSNISCHIQDKNGQKLSDVRIDTLPKKLDQPFQIRVPNEKNLDLNGNKIIFDIDYEYEGQSEDIVIEFPFDRSGVNKGILLLILIIVGGVVFAVVLFSLYRLVRSKVIGPGNKYKIMVGQIRHEGMRPDEEHTFTLNDKEKLSFGSEHTDGFHLDVGSPAFIRCHEGEFILCENPTEEKERTLMSGETLLLKRDEDDDILIYFEIVNDKPNIHQESNYTVSEDDDDNLIPF